jgi:hypothetical protein
MAEEDPLDRLIVRDGKAVVPAGGKLKGNNIEYQGKIYDATNGTLIGTVKDGVDEKKRQENADRIEAVKADPFGTMPGIWTFLGIDPDDAAEFFQRFGLILLGAAVVIIGVALVIAGSKAAQNVVGAIPAGKLLKG